MADPIPSACPFDGFASPILQKGTHANDGTATYSVICPICRIHTPELRSMQAAVDAWDARVAAPTPTYVTWLASAATEAGVAADVAAFAAWIVAHPPVAD
jgi:hypothetical protein